MKPGSATALPTLLGALLPWLLCAAAAQAASIHPIAVGVSSVSGSDNPQPAILQGPIPYFDPALGQLTAATVEAVGGAQVYQNVLAIDPQTDGVQAWIDIQMFDPGGAVVASRSFLQATPDYDGPAAGPGDPITLEDGNDLFAILQVQGDLSWLTQPNDVEISVAFGSKAASRTASRPAARRPACPRARCPSTTSTTPTRRSPTPRRP